MDILTGVFLALAIVAILACGGLVYYIVRQNKKGASAERKAEKIIAEAEEKSQKILHTAQVEAKQTSYEAKQEIDREIKERKQEIAALENKLNQRENSIERRDVNLNEKEKILDQKSDRLDSMVKANEEKSKELQAKLDSIILELEKVAKMSREEAKKEVLDRVKEKMDHEITAYMKKREEEAEESAADKARNLIALATNKYAQDEITMHSVSTVQLPSDEMKGRIIGREGRNIRTLEQLLGVDLIIDDTPETITVSSFNPLRREIAKRTLEYLIKDGRIQPSRIEEFAKKAAEEMNEQIHKAGQEAAFKLGLPHIANELLDYVGRLKFRTSYGQNAYDHSMDVAYLAGIMAGELGLDQTAAKRAGLLHDIGKAIDYEVEGTHVELGARLAKKFGEPDVVVNSIASHHGDEEAKFVIATLVAAADTLSAARPGARSETLETYVQRIEQLEKICTSYPGVAKAFAMQSGREVRVMVVPEQINDEEAYKLARTIKEKIQSDVTYPGEIKINVIREYRATETAK